ncbi:MAG TPA: hypothetical protein VNW29_03500 [Candidatus Sulfotelmatobacter sp.]|jgi:hypothetical protein|nr:hypothetical protein [Candidatus Sulfotelmatobacter sp.]
MPVELQEGPKTQTEASPSAQPRRKGRSALIDGYDTTLGRRKNPETYPDVPHGQEKKVQGEQPINSEVQELRKKFTEDFHDDLIMLINMRRDYTSTQEFHQFLKDSGHAYYIAQFDKLTKPKAGTSGRLIEIDEDKFGEFVSTDRGIAQIYKIRQVKLNEQLRAAAAAFGENPQTPLPGMVELQNATIEPGGPLREAARGMKHWWKEKRGKPGNRGEGYDNKVLRVTVGTKGRLTLTLGGANITLGSLGAGIGGTVGGPAGALVGAVLGIVGTEGAALLMQASKKGVNQELTLSANALMSIIGDPNSANADNRVPNHAKIEWMRRAYNLDPTDYTNVNGQVQRREGIVGMTGVDKDKLAKTLFGTAKELMDFQAAELIPPEHREVIDFTWIYGGTVNRPQQGTPLEQKFFAKFRPDQYGRQDMNGNTHDRQTYLREPDVIIPRETLTTDRIADHDVDAPLPPIHHYNAGDPLPIGTYVPEYVNPTTGIFVPAHEVTASGETAQLAFDEPKIFSIGDPVPVGTVIPEFTNAAGVYFPARRVMRPGMLADHEFQGFQRFFEGSTIQAGRLIPEHWAPGPYMTDSSSKRIQRWERNPNFDENNLDTISNIRRADEAIEQVLIEENNVIFQSLIDGKTDYEDKTFKSFQERKAGSMPGSAHVDSEKKKMSEKSAALETDRTKLQEEAADISTFLENIQVIRDKIAETERLKTAEEAKVTITLSGGRRRTPTVEEALTIANTENRTVTVTIDGIPITALEAQRQKLKTAINTLYRNYRKNTVDKLETAAKRARAAERRAETTLRDAASIGAVTEATMRYYAGQLEEKRQLTTASEKSLNDAQTRATAYYDELVRDPKDNELRSMQAGIERQEELLRNTQEAIKKHKEQIELETKALSSTTTEKFAETAGIFTSMPDAMSTIVSWGINEADLRSKTYDDLLKLINTENTTHAARGWPTTSNLSGQNRLMLLHAIAEARAAEIEPAIGSPSTNFQNAVNETIWGLHDIDLITLSTQQIAERMRARSSAIGRPIPSDTDIDGIRSEAAKRLVARQNMLVQVEGDTTHRYKILDADLKKIDSEGLPTPLLDGILRAKEQYDKINMNMKNFLPDDISIGRLFGIAENRLNTFRTSTPKVGDIDFGKFMDKVYENIFSWKNNLNASYQGEHGPQAALRIAKELLPQNDYEELVIRKFGLGGISAGTGRAYEIVINLLALNPEELRVGLAELHSEEVIYNYLANKPVAIT